MAVFAFVKFQVCLTKVNINFDPEFGSSRFETPIKLNVFNFQQLLILLFGFVQALAEKPGVLILFLSHFFFKLSNKRGFSNPAFQTQQSKFGF